MASAMLLFQLRSPLLCTLQEEFNAQNVLSIWILSRFPDDSKVRIFDWISVIPLAFVPVSLIIYLKKKVLLFKFALFLLKKTNGVEFLKNILTSGSELRYLFSSFSQNRNPEETDPRRETSCVLEWQDLCQTTVSWTNIKHESIKRHWILYARQQRKNSPLKTASHKHILMPREHGMVQRASMDHTTHRHHCNLLQEQAHQHSRRSKDAFAILKC